MRRSGMTGACLALALLACGDLIYGDLPTAYGHHPGHSQSRYWMGGYIVTGYPYNGWGTYGPGFNVTGLSVYGPQVGVPFGGVGGMMGGGPVGGGQMMAGPMAGPAVGGQAGGGQAGGGQAGPLAGANPAAPAAAANGGQHVVGGAAPGDFQTHGKPRTTNTESKARAGKFIQHGDSLFVKQKYNSALERYREAATTAPDLAEAYFRQVFALLGSSQYDSAKKALDRGLRVRPNWPDMNFELSTLYGPTGRLARNSHRESLAMAIEQNPQSADLLLLMGVLLYCDGERDRSQLFFDRAIELGANADHLFDHFIAPRPGVEQAAQGANRAAL